MPTLDLTDDELRVVTTALIKAPLPWEFTNPVLMKITQAQQPATPAPIKTNSDKRHERRIPDQP